MVGAGVLGRGALAVDQEAVPPPLLRQGCLVAVGHIAVQLGLLAADGLHTLDRRTGGPEEEEEEEGDGAEDETSQTTQKPSKNNGTNTWHICLTISVRRCNQDICCNALLLCQQLLCQQ